MALFWRIRRRGGFLRVKIFLLLLVLAVALIDAQIRPVIKSMAANQAKVYATRVINDAVSQRLSGEDAVDYAALVKVTTDNAGKVTSVQADMVRLNTLKAEMTSAASEQLSLLQSQTIMLPIGTLTGLQLLSGRGPRVEFKIIPAGFVNSTLNHSFDSAGINQTRHRIVMELSATITAILPGYSAASEVSSSLILAETVIVGVSPQSFTQVITKNDEIPGLIADYSGNK